MAMEATDTMATMAMARGRLRLPLMPLPAMDMVMDTAMDMVMVTDMAMEAMDIMDMAMARGRLRLPLLLSPAMDMVMDMAAMDITATAMARGLLMLSPDMDTMVIMDM